MIEEIQSHVEALKSHVEEAKSIGAEGIAKAETAKQMISDTQDFVTKTIEESRRAMAELLGES